jgi:hypothetical protein
MAVGTPAATPALKRIVDPQFLPNANGVLYTFSTTNPSGLAQITSFTLANQNAGAVKVTLYLVPSGQTVGASYILIPAINIAANTSYIESASADAEIWVLKAGDSIQGFASVASAVVITMNDREYV